MHIRFAFVDLDTPRAGGTLRPVLEFLRTFLHCADPDAVGLADTAQDIAGRFQPLSQAGLVFVEPVVHDSGARFTRQDQHHVA